MLRSAGVCFNDSNFIKRAIDIILNTKSAKFHLSGIVAIDSRRIIVSERKQYISYVGYCVLLDRMALQSLVFGSIQ